MSFKNKIFRDNIKLQKCSIQILTTAFQLSSACNLIKCAPRDAYHNSLIFLSSHFIVEIHLFQLKIMTFKYFHLLMFRGAFKSQELLKKFYASCVDVST